MLNYIDFVTDALGLYYKPFSSCNQFLCILSYSP